jgi:hypothetical protein
MTARAIRSAVLLGLGVMLTHGPGILSWLGYVGLVCFVALLYCDLNPPHEHDWRGTTHAHYGLPVHTHMTERCVTCGDIRFIAAHAADLNDLDA